MPYIFLLRSVSCIYLYLFLYSDESIKYTICNSSAVQIGNYNYMDLGPSSQLPDNLCREEPAFKHQAIFGKMLVKDQCWAEVQLLQIVCLACMRPWTQFPALKGVFWKGYNVLWLEHFLTIFTCWEEHNRTLNFLSRLSLKVILSFLSNFFRYIITCMTVFSACTIFVPGAQRGQKNVSDPLE